MDELVQDNLFYLLAGLLGHFFFRSYSGFVGPSGDSVVRSKRCTVPEAPEALNPFRH